VKVCVTVHRTPDNVDHTTHVCAAAVWSQSSQLQCGSQFIERYTDNHSANTSDNQDSKTQSTSAEQMSIFVRSKMMMLNEARN